MSRVPRHSRLLPGMSLAGLLWWCEALRGAPPRPPTPQEPTTLTLRTDILVPPLVLADTPEPQGITALALQVTFDAADEGRGLLTFEVGTSTVNTFGDILEGPTPLCRRRRSRCIRFWRTL